MNENVFASFYSEDWLNVFRQLEIALIITDGQGKVIFCNDKYVEVCKYDTVGVTAENVIGLNMRELLEKGHLEPHQSAALLCLERKEKIRAIFQSRLYKLVMSTAIPIFAQDGSIRYTGTVVQDENEIFRLTSTSEEVRKMYSAYLAENEQRLKERVVIVSEPMKHILEQCLQVSSSDLAVLVLGESGVGKEVIPRLIHDNSPRRDQPFIALNCGAIPENLIESELFGYAPGAFTGASKNGKMGAFEAANRGTIMLDEIGDLSLPMQVKLLRVLENRQITRIGSVRPIQVDFRLISATNKNLIEKVERGEFRKDLYYRINAFRVVIPPLRERAEDVSALITPYLSLYNLKYKYNRRISSAATKELLYYQWPGNIRELRNVMEQLVVLSTRDEIAPELVRAILYGNGADGSEPAVEVRRLIPLKQAVSMTEIQILEMVKQVETSSYKAARLLEVDQTTVLRKLKKYHIEGFHSEKERKGSGI